ncbi:MAG: ferrous iron transport protein B [Oscillospiraceae bacterium]|nr:ferrous iron transport protein B [Oscillospiraceae bacterium]MCI6972395.1 ferrous iron transport protein B [Clostridiales bacterium]MDY2909160.1 ferrous iron transport protein B [Oscillospiraceae bacterium]
MVIALVGNQNCGKTTLFNQLTGSNQHVGNFPGVTVEHKSGEAKGRKDCTIVDLPGIYSIRPYSGEEVVTRNFIIDNSPDAILNIADATNIERNLYLTLQLAEMGKPMVLALNMMDELLGNHGSVNIEELSSRLGIPVLPISAAKNDGVEELLELTMETARKKQKPKKVDFCGAGPVHRCIHTVSHVVEDHADAIGVPSRFAATRVIEQDEEIIKRLGLSENELELVEHAALEMERESGLDRNAALADMRYRFIESVCADTVVKAQESKEQQRSVKIDKVLTNKYLAIPTFLAIMAFIFWMTFDVIGQRLSDLLAVGIAMFTDWVDALLTAYGLNPVVQSLIIDGVFAGVGSMLSFLPLIVVLFFFLSILEDTGYMSRVAFVMDKLLRKIGLSGRSFVPMLIGFGCSVPAVMATRTLSSERDRKMTMLLVPFMSCSAKIPIYALFTAAFFPGDKLLVMTLLYIGGMLTGIVAAKILSLTSFTGKPVPFVMELPNYRMPSLKSVLLLMWEKARDFIRRAFTVIFLATIVIWFLQHFDAKLNIVEAGDGSSLLSLIGMSVAPIFAPLGFADWRIATSLITGLMAKEAVVSTMGVLMNASGSALAAALTGVFTTQSAIAFLAFALLYTPCVAAISAMRKELGSGLKTAGVVIGQCCVAWIVAFAVYCVAGLVL